MRKAITRIGVLSAALISLTIAANAQWTRNAVSGITYITNAADKVGIGTAAPSYSLDIKQDGNCSFRVQSKVNGSSNMILSRSAVAGNNCLVNYKTGNTDIWRTGVSGSNDDFKITNATGVDVLLANQTGNVGIGTIAPTQRLHVIGNTLVSGTITSGGNTIVGGNLDVTGYVGFGSVEQLTDGGAFTIASNSSFIPTSDGIRSLGTSAMRWNSIWASGSVGIGVTSASTKLHVNGGTDVDPASGGYVTIGDIAGLNIGMDDNEIMARSNGLTSPLYLQNNGGNLIMCNASGNVTIGTSIPAAGYILSVDGKVMAEEVRVELSGNWPDYVFSADHNLMSIEALENHVNEFKHLPGIPSAKEVEANGISLGQMQTKTIEKLEENSLYIIQLNNKIETQNAVIAKLIKELEEIKNNK